MTGFVAIIRRDVALGFRAGGGGVQTVFFFALVSVIFALAIGPDIALLSQLAAPIIWAGVLLSALVSLDRIFQADFEDGSLDVLVEASEFLEVTVLAKASGHWLSACAPLIVAAPLIAVLFNLPAPAFWPLLASLIVGTPALSLIGAIGAGLALSIRRASVLTTILVTPLFAPTLIFGVSAAEAGAAGSPGYFPSMMLLGAATLFSVIAAPLAGAAAIRFNLR